MFFSKKYIFLYFEPNRDFISVKTCLYMKKDIHKETLMHKTDKEFFLLNSKNFQSYRKNDHPYPKGIIFNITHMSTKEKYVSPYCFEYKKTFNVKDCGLWW